MQGEVHSQKEKLGGGNQKKGGESQNFSNPRSPETSSSKVSNEGVSGKEWEEVISKKGRRVRWSEQAREARAEEKIKPIITIEPETLKPVTEEEEWEEVEMGLIQEPPKQ